MKFNGPKQINLTYNVSVILQNANNYDRHHLAVQIHHIFTRMYSIIFLYTNFLTLNVCIKSTGWYEVGEPLIVSNVVEGAGVSWDSQRPSRNVTK